MRRNDYRALINRALVGGVLLGAPLVQAAAAQPNNCLLARVRMVESRFGRGTIFSLDVDQREYWITAKHILNGAERPPYGDVRSKSERLKILNPTLQGEQWLTVDFSVLDPGQGIDIVVLAPRDPILSNPPPNVTPSTGGIAFGGECEFLGFPYGGGWRAILGDGTSTWMPYVKHCFLSGLPQEEKRFWVLDGINNAGFSGGPVVYGTGPQQQVFGVVSGYLTEPTDVISSSLRQVPQPPQRPRKGSQAMGGAGRAKQRVNVNSGFIIAFDIQYAIQAIHKNPVGPLRRPR